MVQIKVFVAVLAAGFVQNALAGACKPKSYTSSVALSNNGIEVSYSVVETTNTAESYSETQLSSGFESSTTDTVITSVATSGDTQSISSIEVSSSMAESTNSLESSSTEIMTTSIAASTMTLDTTTTALETITTSTSAGPSEPTCGVLGTCSSPGCRSIMTTGNGVYLGECQDLCKAHINCELIVYNAQIGQCFLMEHIGQGSGWYDGPRNSLVRYDNSCEIEKREPDPICEKWGFCPDCEAVHQRGGHTRTTCHAACLASDECESFTIETTVNGCFFNKKSLFKSGFFPDEEGRLWFDNACDVIG